ncbi:MAG: asparagine synthase-related protein [Acidimicrobiales bacterium]
MGGLAIRLDWDHPAQDIEHMIRRVPHRCTATTSMLVKGRLAAAELATSTEPPLSSTPLSIEGLTLVADLRLWGVPNQYLAADSLAVGWRRFILETYRRKGLDGLDVIDGDFAFVIFDHERNEVIAVRDRFGTKPLFYRVHDDGISFASETKQLLGAGEVPTACDIAVAEHLADRPEDLRYSFYEGIRRLRPAHVLIARKTGEIERRYWFPKPSKREVPIADLSAEFKDRLVDSVRRHGCNAVSVASQMSGGLDSGSIAAAAKILAKSDSTSPHFSTISAIFPGLECDEQQWIDALVEDQPFEHRSFVPPVDSIELYVEDMWQIDSPRVDRQRGVWSRTTELATELGATRLMTGLGGDEVAHEEHLLTDLLHQGSFIRWWKAATAGEEFSWNSRRTLLEHSLRGVVPDAARPLLRRLRKNTPVKAHLCTSDEFRAQILAMPESETHTDFGFDSITQNMIISYTNFPGMSLAIELLESLAAHRGLEMTHPFLDRELAEFAASISTNERPFDGRWKTLIRQGFDQHMPNSVLNRTRKTMFSDSVTASWQRHCGEFQNRFTQVTPPALRYLDPNRYQTLLAKIDNGTADGPDRDSLWTAWTLMLWLDGLTPERYA